MFFTDAHAELGARLVRARDAIDAAERGDDEAARDRGAVLALAKADLFELVAPASGKVDARALCLARELLGYVSPRADSIFAVQGLGVHALLLARTPEQPAEVKTYARGS